MMIESKIFTCRSNQEGEIRDRLAGFLHTVGKDGYALISMTQTAHGNAALLVAVAQREVPDAGGK